ncbi:flagellar hook-associated protein FlgL [Neptunomonas phycophila]|uniref:flagellar hook-associated protein FlgL n=1 Tax=Neptunomonas phycophila TaxID=1572645 RepID=UPI001FEC2F1D|nr:flagellar hook-associated protein FlgL [Neptunomonas phycophila]
MRISTQQQFLKTVDNMQRTQTNMAELQEQASSGKRLQTPSDDPVAAAQVVKLERELAQYSKFEDNIDVTERRLQLEETILDSMYTATTRFKELGIYAGNSTLTSADRATIATEVEELTEYMASLMNTQDSLGEYIFAGSKGGTQPYEQLGDGSYQYNGDDGQRHIQVGTNLYIPSNDSGSYLFEAVEGRLEVGMTGASVSAGSPFLTVPPAGATFSTAFEDTDKEAAFLEVTKGLGDLTVTISHDGTNSNFSITDSSGTSLAGGVFNDGDTIEYEGLAFDLAALSPGDPDTSITLDIAPEQMNILDVAQNFSTALRNVEGEELNEILATTLNQFEQAADRNLEATSALGTRLSSIEKITDSNADFKLFTQTALSSLVDADLTEVLSQYALEETALQASQALFGRITSLSLFDYIN